MATDFYHWRSIRYTRLHREHVGNVYANVVDGLDDVETLHWDIPRGFGVSGSHNTRAVFPGKKILPKCMEGD